jgi:allantoinase
MSPWDGRTLTGVVDATWVHGALAYRAGEGVLARAGREILAEPATLAGWGSDR